MESIYPGKFIGSGLVFFVAMLIYFPLHAQQSMVELPFLQGSRLLLNHVQPEINNPQKFSLQGETLERKSPAKAFFYSLLLPGTGEAYVGETVQSKIFLGLELVGWGLVVSNIINVNMRESDYKNFAVEHAVLNRTGKDDQFWIDIGKYDTIFQYNEQRRRERDINAIYEENQFFFWNWDKRDNRLYYDAQRIDAREIERDRLYFFAAIALNHLISAVNALRLANSHNREIEGRSFNLNLNYHPGYKQFLFSFEKAF